MFHINFNKKSGQTIIEAVVALSSIVIILTAVTIVVTQSVNNAQFIKSQSIASKYSLQGMEVLRYTRNNDPATFFGYTGTFCMKPDNTLLSSGTTCGTPYNFSGTLLIREVVFSPSSPDCSNGTRATVNTYWSSSKCGSTNGYCHKSQLISCFSLPTVSGTSL
ncbi:MAG TPA: hypothetical protein VG965_01995 [Patescibacteria group bacterium]|nr:hypothetical protein [Patescibacteria group bacterium]